MRRLLAILAFLGVPLTALAQSPTDPALAPWLRRNGGVMTGAITLGHTSTGAEPFTCASPTAGAILFNTTTSQAWLCNGTSWGAMGSGGGVTITSPVGSLSVGGTSTNPTLDFNLAHSNIFSANQLVNARAVVGSSATTNVSLLTLYGPADVTNIGGTTTVNGSTAMTGSGTTFLTSLAVGDRISVSSNPTTYATVTAIADNTHLTSSAVLGDGTSQTINRKSGILRADDAGGTTRMVLGDDGTLLVGTTSREVGNGNAAQPARAILYDTAQAQAAFSGWSAGNANPNAGQFNIGGDTTSYGRIQEIYNANTLAIDQIGSSGIIALRVNSTITGLNIQALASNHATVGLPFAVGTSLGSPSLRISDAGAGAASSIYSIGFGYDQTAAPTFHNPVEIGAVETNSASNTAAEFFIATRSVTSNTAPTERFRITSDGAILLSNPGSAPAVSPSGKATIYFDGTNIQISINGGAYQALTIP